MDDILGGRGATRVAELKVFVKGLKGPMEEGWEAKVAGFVEGLQAKLARASQGWHALTPE